jgi:tyrosine-protein phosphatase SIW14
MTSWTCVLVGLASLSVPVWAGDGVPTIPNFHQVNNLIYRGGQPSGQDWQSLAKLGVKTVVDLRRESEHSTREEARAVESTGMRYVNVPLEGLSAPPNQAVARVLAILNSGESVFVHCRAGRDRTGTMIACYRISHDRWENRKALQEAKSFGIHWFEGAMKNYILRYQPPSAPAAIEAGLAPVAAN